VRTEASTPQRRISVSDVREQTSTEDVEEPVAAPVSADHVADGGPDPEDAAVDDVDVEGSDVGDESEQGVSGRPARETRVRGGGGRVEAVDAAKSSDDVVSDKSVDDADDEEDDDEDENTLEGEAEIAADYLEELLDIADLDGDIDTYIEGDRAHVSIVSESQVLVGEKGEVLDALQELTRLAVMTETGDRSRLMLDVAGFRDRRRQQLVTLAGSAVEQAKSTQQSVPLDPMNPFERKIVHDAVAAAGLSSESEGDEPLRHVVVQPHA
jgi:spoIIIJ-associated protein